MARMELPLKTSWPASIVVPFMLLASCGLPEYPTTDSIDPNLPDNPFVPNDNFVPGEADAPGFVLTSVEPSRGPITGGTRIEVIGAGFEQGSMVVFGASQGHEVVVQNQTSILATTPPGPAGLVDVGIIRPDGKAAFLEDAFFFETDIFVDHIEPAHGPVAGGTPVTVRGSGFLEGSTLVIGGRLALSTHVLDTQTIIAVTPPGAEGPRDVTVFNPMGFSSLRKAFSYVSEPLLDSCDPAVVTVGSETSVVVTGSHIDSTHTVLVSNGLSSMAGDPEHSSIVMELEPYYEGPVDVTVITDGGSASIHGCVWSLAKDPGIGPRVHGVVPSSGPAAGGYTRDVVVTGIKDGWWNDVSVSLGGVDAPVIGSDASTGLLTIDVHEHAVGIVDCAISTPGGAYSAEAAYEFLPLISISYIEPTFGPSSGGTNVTIHGTHLEQVDTVFIGPLPATVVQGPSPSSLIVKTAPANPGIHDVRVVTSWDESKVLQGAFTFGAMEPGLFTVTPHSGSIAGGTLVSVVGSGLSDTVEVRFGSRTADVMDASDPAHLLVYTPTGPVGPADVSAKWPDGTLHTLNNAYTYFDPTGYFGGVWGEVVSGAVNVTVLDSYNHKPISGAFAMLGSDSHTIYRGATDIRGQITFSGLDIFGPVQVTASRADYSTFTIAGVDAENVTLFLEPVVPSSGGGGGGSAQPLPPGIVAGNVLGADKYILAPPASCSGLPLVHGALCRPCVEDMDCGDDGLCLNTSGAGHFCATLCESEGDCPTSYDCYGIGPGKTACLPSPGIVEVRCGTSESSVLSYLEDPGPGHIAGEDGEYALNSRLGDIAVYCVGGFRRFSDGVFEPVAMGLLRHVSVYPAEVTYGQDMWLNIPLDRELVVRLLNVPGGPGGPNIHSVRIAVDLGSDGYLLVWPRQEYLDEDRFVFPDLPRDFHGVLDDAVIYLRSEADSQTPNDIPYSVSVEREWSPGASPRLLKVSDDQVELLDPDARPDATGGCGPDTGGGIVFSPGGRTWAVDIDGIVSQLPSLASVTLRSCVYLPEGNVLSVGDFGAIVRSDTFSSTQETAPTSARLSDVDVSPDGTEYAVGDGVLLIRPPDSSWARIDYGSNAPLNGVAAAPDGTALSVGAGGLVVRIKNGKATHVLPCPTAQDLMDVIAFDWGVLAVGDNGTSVIGGFDGGLAVMPTPVEDDLLVVMDAGDGSALAAGATGTLIRFQNGGWTIVDTHSFKGELTTLIPGAAGSALALSGDVAVLGPFLYLPVFSSPLPGNFWTNMSLKWSRERPPAPSLTYTRLYGPKSSREWAVMSDGPVLSVTLPDLVTAAESFMQLSPLPHGEIKLHNIQILMDHFDFNAFDTNAFSMSSWRSWTVEDFYFLYP